MTMAVYTRKKTNETYSSKLSSNRAKRKRSSKTSLSRNNKKVVAAAKAKGSNKCTPFESDKVISAALKKIKNVIPSSPLANPHSDKHERHCQVIMDDFLKVLIEHGNNAFSDLLKEVPFEGPDGVTSHAPNLFVALGGQKTGQKLQLCNKALVVWMKYTKKKRKAPKDKYIWYQPVSQNQRLRTFIAAMQNRFGWQIKLDDLNFKGGVLPEVQRLYEKRYKEFGKVSNLFLNI